MKIRNLLLGALLLSPVGFLHAQTGVTDGSPFGHGEDSIRCRENISLLTSYAKSENYKDARLFWEKAYKECPGASKNIYIYGVKILTWELENAASAQEKAAKLDELLALYDKRAEYFGDDAKYGRDWILSQKISDYMRYVAPEKLDYDLIYKWTSSVVSAKSQKIDPQVVYFHVFSSLNKAIGHPEWHEKYINDYMAGNDHLEQSIELSKSAGDTTTMEFVQTLKDQLDGLFAQSGLADCKMLADIYGKNLEANKTNQAYLQAMLDMFRISDCEDSPLYFKASKYMFAIRPTAASAVGLAREALSNKRISEATDYLNKAISLTQDHKLKAQCYYTLATIQMNARSYSQARALCNKAMAENPNMGAPLILIAQMYASSASSIYPDDPVKQRCVFYLVMDKLERARSVDSSVAGKAGQLIATYRRSLPSSSDIFMHPELDKGKTFHVGGWIGESTVIR